VHGVKIVEMNDEESYDPDDVLERQFIMLPKKTKLRYQNKIGNIYERMKTSEWKTVSEKLWAKVK
jgi:hypothetical protein